MESDQQSNQQSDGDLNPTTPLGDDLPNTDGVPTSEEPADGVVTGDDNGDADTKDAQPAETEVDESASDKADVTQPSVAPTDTVGSDDDPLHDLPEITEAPVLPPAATRLHRKGDLEAEMSAPTVAAELKRIETAVRSLLEDRDTRRKRRLGGSSRWFELEDDIRSWRFSGRFDEATLDRLTELIQQRHFLFNHLRFIGSTRPTWNS